MITVFTPTYNRKRELERLYNSLLNQDYNDFEWLIVDDGSSDDTENFIKELIKDNKININYIKKENGGKPSAYNKGLDCAKGNVFLSIDSDDVFRPNVLSKIASDFDNIVEDDIGGAMYLQSYINDREKIIGSVFPADNMIVNYFDVYHKFKVTGDKLIVLKTEVARKFYFPIIENEKFVPEALVFNRISKKYKFKCFNFITTSKEYLTEGYSNNYFTLVKRNPLGNMLYFMELYGLDKSLYNIYGYILFGIYGKVKFCDLLKHKAKIMIALLYLPVRVIAMLRK